MTADIIKGLEKPALREKSNRPVQDFYAETSCQQAYGSDSIGVCLFVWATVCSRIMLCNSMSRRGFYCWIGCTGRDFPFSGDDMLPGAICNKQQENGRRCGQSNGEMIQSIHDGELREEKNDVGRPPDWEGYGKPE